MTSLLESAFQFGDINQTASLGKSTVVIQIDGNTHQGEGEAHLRLLPKPRVEIESEFQGVPPDASIAIGFGHKEIQSFVFGGKKIEGHFLEIGGVPSQEKFTLRWAPRSEPTVWCGDNSITMQRLVFHLFNFQDILGTRHTSEQRGSTRKRIAHVNLDAGDWKVELRSLWETQGRFEKLKAEGGYGLTHIGSLQKTDNSSFSGQEAQKMLDTLRFFFSFAQGLWCNPVCSIGFDDAGNRVWESWSSPQEPWTSPPSWFDRHHAEQLTALFPGFVAKCDNQDWYKAFSEIIYWYLNSNHARIDVGIILTQAAIERFSYEYVVKDKKLKTPKAFKGLKASEEFRLLFSSLRIPLNIPSSLSEISTLATQCEWFDSSHALTEIRNAIIHPERSAQYSTNTYLEAWNLGLWYLELALLGVCGYNNSYGNRLVQRRVGEVVDVPWR